MPTRFLPSLLLLALAAPGLSFAQTTVQVGFRGGVYRGPASAAADSMLAFSSRDGVLPAALTDLRLELPAGTAPLTRAWVLGALTAQAPKDVTFAWYGPELLQRAPALQQETAETLVLAAQTVLDGFVKERSSDYALQVVGKPEAPVLEAGVVTLKARMPAGARLRPRMAVPVDIYVDGALARSVTVWFAVQARAEVPVYTHAMQAEQALAQDDLRWEERDLAALGAEPLAVTADLKGKWLERPVQAGQAALAGDIGVEPLVQRQQRVEVRLQEGKVAITAWGTAKQSGNRGDVVEVRVDESEGDCRGRVIDRGVVQIGN